MRKILSLFALLVTPLTAANPTNEPPNVVIIYADDLGFGDLSCYNADGKIPTPNLDKLASEGIRFTDGHSSSGICTPSRYALLTGRHHWRDFHGIAQSFGESVFKPERITLPEFLQANGYHTACIGKWHLGWDWDAIRKPGTPKKSVKFDDFDWTKSVPDGPLAHGFDEYFGDAVINFPPYAWIENDKLPVAPDQQLDPKKWKKIKEGSWECRPGPMVEGWDPYANLPTLTDRTIAHLKQRKAANKPFFLYFALPCPHAPIVPNDEFDGKSGAGAFGDFVVETDHHIGRVLDTLKEQGLDENTLVIFTADNGPEAYCYSREKKFGHWSAAPFRGVKRDVYEGGHHVPFIIRYPGVAQAGKVEPALVSQIDLMATIAAAIGKELPTENCAEDSHNLLPLIKGEKVTPRTEHVHNTYPQTWALRSGDWLLLQGKNGYHNRGWQAWEKKHNYPADNDSPIELYNLKDDIAQRHNLAEKHPEKAAKLQQRLKQLRTSPRTAPLGDS